MDSLNNVAGNADVALDSRYPYVSRLCIYVGNNPNDSDYISRCSFEMTHLEAQVKSGTTLFSLPCDASAGFGSVAVSTASAGEKLVVTGDLVNTLGQSWHQVFVNGSHLYVKQTEIGFVRFWMILKFSPKQSRRELSLSEGHSRLRRPLFHGTV